MTWAASWPLGATVCALALGAGGAAMASDGMWEIEADGWSHGSLEDSAQATAHGLSLAAGAARGAWQGSLEIAPADRVLLSVNPAPFPAGATVRVSLRVELANDEARSPWLPLGVYGDGPQLPASASCDPWRGVRVETDLVRARGEPIVGVEVRLELSGGDGGAPRVRRLALSHWRGKAQPDPEAVASPAWGRTLEPPQRSQCVEDPAIAGRICSPTSLGMALAFHGRDLSTLQVARGVYDHAAAIYGNWSFNAAFAASQGFDATALHFGALSDLEAEIAAGRPVVISHKWGPGEMSATPHRASDGHLILVVGFTASGDLVVHDPAADPRDGEAIRRIYPRAEVQRSWLVNGEGVAYVLRPSDDDDGARSGR